MLLRRAYVRAVVVAVAILGVASAIACGTEPVGVDACRKIEGARCENARSCGIDLARPRHEGDSPSDDVGACRRYYEDACLHGLVTSVEPGSVLVDECVTAINESPDCEIIKSPEKSPKCSFLIPPAAPVAPVVDAAPETATD